MSHLIKRLHNPDLGILFIRLGLAAAFMHAGWLKLMDMNMVIGRFAQAGIPAVLAYLVTYVELIGGFFLLLGVFSRYAAILLAIILVVAIFLVHWSHGFGMQNGGYEYPLVLLLSALAITVMGEGAYSVKRLLKK